MTDMKETFYGVNEIHTLQVPNDSTNLYVGMNVQSNKRKSDEEVVMIFSEEQVLEMYEYLIRRVMEKNRIVGQNYSEYKNKK
jgi:hypothetical protein